MPASLQAAHYRVVVKNTFVNVVDDSSSIAAKQCKLRPVRSESSLCRQTTKASTFSSEMGKDTEAHCPQHRSGSGDAVSTTTTAADLSRESVSTEDRHHGCEGDDVASDGLPDIASEATADWKGAGLARTASTLWQVQGTQRLTSQNVALLEARRHVYPVCQGPDSMSVPPTPRKCSLASLPVQDYGYSSVLLPAQIACSGQARATRKDPSTAPSIPLAPAAISVSPSNDNSEGHRTTVMLGNLPDNFTRSMLVALLESKGFGSAYNFLYLPIDFRARASLGYAFLDLTHAGEASGLWSTFEGFADWSVPCDKACFVTWCQPYQGLETLIERYRNSPVMHAAVPDDFKPLLLRNGQRVPLPPPTRPIRAPRVRHCRRDSS